MYKIRGQIKKLQRLDVEFNNETHKKVLLTIEETDTGFNHIQQFELFGEAKINVIEHSKKLAEGQMINIDFYIKTREYNDRFYNTLMIKNIQIERELEGSNDD